MKGRLNVTCQVDMTLRRLKAFDQLIAELHRRDPQYGQIAQLQHVAGLRREETAHLQACCIAEDGSRVLLQGPGTHAKGGREIPINDENHSS
jgi:hypothetical protein